MKCNAGFRDRALALVVAVGVLLCGAVANADPYEDALAGFTTDPSATPPTPSMRSRRLVIRVPRPLLDALKDRTPALFGGDKARFHQGQIRQADGCGDRPAVASPPADAGNIRLNNRLRGMLDAALGSLTLMAKEPAGGSTQPRPCSSHATPARCPISTRPSRRRQTRASERP